MCRLTLRFLLYVSLFLFFFSACSPRQIKVLQREQKPCSLSIGEWRQATVKATYRCHVEGKSLWRKYYLSGLLHVMQEDQQLRVVFQNEMGITFFDFLWTTQQGFGVQYIIPQLNRNPIVKTLKKDFEILFSYPDFLQEYTSYYCFYAYKYPTMEAINLRHVQSSSNLLYILEACESNFRPVYIQHGNRRTMVGNIDLKYKDSTSLIAQTILIEHHKANFTINLELINPIQ